MVRTYRGEKMRFGHSLWNVLALVVCFLVAAVVVQGQAGTSGTISGTVTDPAGA